MSHNELGSLVDLSFSEQSDVVQCEFTNSEVHEQSYYEVLGVDPRATRLEIREAYLKQKVTFAPESDAAYSLIDRDGLRSYLDRIEEAYGVLSDEFRRRDYDRQCGRIAGAIHAPDVSSDAPFARLARNGVTLDEFTSDLDPNEHLRTDRLLIARGEHHKDVTAVSARQPAPFIKFKARSANDPTVQAAMRQLQEQHDLGRGELYRALRLSTNVSEQEICDRTKICITYIQAIETDDLGKLPQVVYVKGFLRSYFNYLAAPRAEDMVNHFAERLEAYKEQQKKVVVDSDR
jgi:hypothetical protein